MPPLHARNINFRNLNPSVAIAANHGRTVPLDCGGTEHGQSAGSPAN
jgi:hypothetical protein